MFVLKNLFPKCFVQRLYIYSRDDCKPTHHSCPVDTATLGAGHL